MAKLRLGFYPYTYARISVMKGELIRPEKWESLLKMGVNELLRYLQDTGYKAEIDSLGVQKRNLAALENALNSNLMRTFNKLNKISDEKVQTVLRIYLKRHDLENFKTIVRAKMASIPYEEIKELLLPSLNHSPEYFNELAKKENVEKMLEELPFSIDPLPLKELDLFHIENILDRAYYEELFRFANNLRGQGKAFREFILAELDILNIKMILRLKKELYQEKEVMQYLIFPSKSISSLAGTEKIEAIAKRLHASGYNYRDIQAYEGLPEAELLTRLESDLDTSLLRKEALLMHQFPLTVNVILGFMFAKEIEVKNLKILLKGKQLGLEEHYLQELLAVA